MSTGLQFAGEVQITKCSIIRTNGLLHSGFDITALLYQIEIFEDLFSTSLSGTIVLVDCLNLVMELPIIGEEIIELEFVTPTFSEKFSKAFYVYKMTDRAVKGNSKNAYVLHIMSLENMYDLNKKISRSFSGYTHEVAKTIYNEYFALDDAESKKDFWFEESTNKVKYVSNYWTPFKNLNYLAKQSTDNSAFKSPSFIFFEGRKRYYFVSLGFLNKQTPTFKYVYDMSGRRDKTDPGEGSSTRDIQREMGSVFSVSFDENFDYIARVMNGTYSHRVIEHNLLNKAIKNHTFSYWYDFDKTKHIGGENAKPICSRFVYYSESGNILEPHTTYDQNHANIIDNSAEIMSKRISLLGHTELYKLKIVVPGRTDMEVGTVVDFAMGDFGQLEEADAAAEKKDKYWSGKYLVTSILHQVSAKEHQMTLTLVKDSVETEFVFPEEVS